MSGVGLYVICDEEDQIDVAFLERPGVKSVEVTDGHFISSEHLTGDKWNVGTSWTGKRLVRVRIEDNKWASDIFPELA